MMDRTVKSIRELYDNGRTDQQRYILSLAMLGDVKPHMMQDLSRRFQKARQDNPKALSHGFQDMELEGKPGARPDMKQALHQIKREGKNVGKALTIDSALASHFADLGHTGMLTRTLESEGIQSATDHASRYDESHRMQMSPSDSDDSNNGNDNDDDASETTRRQRAQRASPDNNQDNPQRSGPDMNRTNRLRHTEEEDETESKLARANREKKGKMQQQMKDPHQRL